MQQPGLADAGAKPSNLLQRSPSWHPACPCSRCTPAPAVCRALREAARRGFTCAVTGDAADELWGGYNFTHRLEEDAWRENRRRMAEVMRFGSVPLGEVCSGLLWWGWAVGNGWVGAWVGRPAKGKLLRLCVASRHRSEQHD